MLRRFGFFMLAIPALAVVPVTSALAQNSRAAPEPYYRAAPPPGAYQDERLPAPGFMTDADDDDAPIMRPQRLPQFGQQSQLPAPSATPGRILPYPDSDAPLPPLSGHQLDAQPAPANAEPVLRPPGTINTGKGPGTAPAPIAPSAASALPPEDQPEVGAPKELPANLKKQMVDYVSKEPAGTIVVDTPNTYLYLVLGNGKAIRYGIGVGREGFTWAGTERVSKMKEWPDWFPPSEMIERQPYLPRFMAGGAGNPLGARALYLGNTLYRIHGTNQPSTIGTTVSSGCIRLINEDIEDLFSRVQTGTRVVVMPGKAPETMANSGAAPAAEPANPMAPPPKAGATAGTAISAQPLPPVR